MRTDPTIKGRKEIALAYHRAVADEPAQTNQCKGRYV